MNKIAIILAGFAVACPLLFAGCESATVSSVCEQDCDCAEQCDRKDVQLCERQGQELQKLAEDSGCGAEFDEVLACSADATCKDGELDVDPCKAKAAAVEKCMGASAMK